MYVDFGAKDESVVLISEHHVDLALTNQIRVHLGSLGTARLLSARIPQTSLQARIGSSTEPGHPIIINITNVMISRT